MQTEHFFIFIDFRIPLMIQGLENYLALRFDKGRRGACLFTILLTLLKNLEKPASALLWSLLWSLSAYSLAAALVAQGKNN